MTVSNVYIHAFKFLPDGSVTYCDEGDAPTGWAVYARIDLDDGEFDVIDETEHATFGDALDQGLALSYMHKVTLEHY